MMSNYIGEICALLTAITWATSMVLFKRSGETIPPMVLNFFKNVIGLVLLLVTVAIAHTPLWTVPNVGWNEINILLVSGFLGIALGDTVFFAALNRVGVGIQSIVDCLYSPLVILFSWLLLSETLTIMHYAGAALVLSGVMLSTRHKLPAGTSSSQLASGILLGAFSMALMAFGIVLAKPVLENENVPLLWATLIRMISGTIPLGIWLLFGRRRSQTVSAFTPGRHWYTCVPASVLGAYVSMILWVAGFAYTKAGIAAVLNQTSTLFAILLATFVLREPLTARKLAAVLLALGGALLVTIA